MKKKTEDLHAQVPNDDLENFAVDLSGCHLSVRLVEYLTRHSLITPRLLWLQDLEKGETRLVLGLDLKSDDGQ